MKHFSAFLFFMALLFSSESVIAQKNTIAMGAFCLPISGYTMAHGSLGYYRHLAGKHSLGLKFMLTTSDLKKVDNEIRFSAANLDLVHRWDLSKVTHRSKWNFEAGISAAWTFTKIPPVDDYNICISGESAEQILEEERYYKEVLSKVHVERRFYTGIATAINWQWCFSSHFGLGMGVAMNLYYSPKDGCQLLAIPNVNAAYNF